jgi:hypothetical protein
MQRAAATSRGAAQAWKSHGVLNNHDGAHNVERYAPARSRNTYGQVVDTIFMASTRM